LAHRHLSSKGSHHLPTQGGRPGTAGEFQHPDAVPGQGMAFGLEHARALVLQLIHLDGNEALDG